MDASVAFTVICFSIDKDSPEFLAMKHQMDVSSLSRRDRCRIIPYPDHYRPALAFSILLCPHPHRLPLRVAFPDWPGRGSGLPCSAKIPGSVRCRLYTEGQTSATAKRKSAVPGPTPFGPSLSAPLACLY